MTERKKEKRVERRRRNLLLHLVGSAAVSAEAVKRLAAHFRVEERTLLVDLEALRDELEAPPIEELPEDLLSAIQAANSFQLLRALGQKLMSEMVNGTIARELGATLVDALREQRHALRAAREEEGHVAIKALEILTAQEEEALRKYRESLVPPALKPGEFPPPPEGAPPPATTPRLEPSGGDP